MKKSKLFGKWKKLVAGISYIQDIDMCQILDILLIFDFDKSLLWGPFHLFRDKFHNLSITMQLFVINSGHFQFTS